MSTQTKPAAGGNRSAGREDHAPRKSSTSSLIAALRWARWNPAETAELRRRRQLAYMHRLAARAMVERGLERPESARFFARFAAALRERLEDRG
jgi:hypothetical protein